MAKSVSKVTIVGPPKSNQTADKIGGLIGSYAAGNRPDWLKQLSETDYQTTTTTNRAAGWAEDAGRNNVAQIQGMTGQGLTAGRMPAEIRGDLMTRDSLGVWNAGLGQADSMTAAGGQSMTDVDMSKYMNQHMAPVLAEINRQGGINRSRAAQEAAAMGAFGDNMSLRTSEVDAATQRNAGLAQAEAWDRAVSAFQSDRSAKLAAGNQMAQLAGMRSDLSMRDASEMRGIGERNRAVQQAALDKDLELAKLRTQAISSAPQTTTTEVTAPGPSRAGQELGALIGLAGMGVTNLPGLTTAAPNTQQRVISTSTGRRNSQTPMGSATRSLIF